MNKKDVSLIIAVVLIVVMYYFLFVNSALTGHFVGDIKVGVDPGIKVYYSLFDGLTTDFIMLDDNNLSELENMTLEKSSYGKIIFLDIVNLTIDTKDNIVDLDSNINISNNFIGINNSELTSLNKSAMIYLYNLNFTNPEIIRDGEICPESICHIYNYTNGIIIFSTNDLSINLSVAEKEIEALVSGGSGGGGAGGAVKKIDFTIKPDFISTSLYQGESKSIDIELVNKVNEILNITSEIKTLDGNILLSEENFSLGKLEKKTVRLNLFTRENQKPGVYIGKIIFRSGSVKRELNIVLEIKEKNALFDIKLSVLPQYKIVTAGKNIKVLIEMKNIGLYGKPVDVELYSQMVDMDKKVLYESSKEIIAVETNTTVFRDVFINKDILPGKYLVIGKLNYENYSIETYDTFDVVEKEIPLGLSTQTIILLAIGLIIFIIIIVFIIIGTYNYHKKNEYYEGLVKKGRKKPQKK